MVSAEWYGSPAQQSCRSVEHSDSMATLVQGVPGATAHPTIPDRPPHADYRLANTLTRQKPF